MDYVIFVGVQKWLGRCFFPKKRGVLQTQRFLVLEDMLSLLGVDPSHKIRLLTFLRTKHFGVFRKPTTSAKLAGPILAVSIPVLENQQKVLKNAALGDFSAYFRREICSGWYHRDPSCHHLPPIFSNHRAFGRTIAFMSPVAHYKACRPSPAKLGEGKSIHRLDSKFSKCLFRILYVMLKIKQ